MCRERAEREPVHYRSRALRGSESVHYRSHALRGSAVLDALRPVLSRRRATKGIPLGRAEREGIKKPR